MSDESATSRVLPDNQCTEQSTASTDVASAFSSPTRSPFNVRRLDLNFQGSSVATLLGRSLVNRFLSRLLSETHEPCQGTKLEANAFFTFTSHIDGKNAKVAVYQDRIEWVRPRGVSGGKLTAGIMTAGVSFLATGFKNGKSGTEMIPVKSMSSVTTSRDGLLNTKVSVITSGNTVDFRVSHAEAAKVKEVLTQLILGTHPSQTEPASRTVPPVAAPQSDVMSQLTKLGELRAAGVLNDIEFETKKSELLGRL